MNVFFALKGSKLFIIILGQILGLFIDLLMIGISSLCYIQGLKFIVRLLLEKRHFEGFYHIRVCGHIGYVTQINLITQLCPCNILQYFTTVKMIIFR